MAGPAAFLSHAQDRPSSWVARFAPLIPPGETLDLACGGGRHARLLAALGHDVIAVDRDPQALAAAQGAGIVTRQIDLESGALALGDAPFEPGRYAGIVITNYLHRPLFPLILASLAPGGVLVYETFTQGNERFGKPSNPDFLLAPGELLDLAHGRLRVIAYEDGYAETPKPAMLQRLCAVVSEEGADPARLRI